MAKTDEIQVVLWFFSWSHLRKFSVSKMIMQTSLSPIFSLCVFVFCCGLNTNDNNCSVSLNIISIFISPYCFSAFIYVIFFSFFFCLCLYLFFYLFTCLYLPETETFSRMRMILRLHHMVRQNKHQSYLVLIINI